MYTQCDHCKAIFEVSMREVTVASGKLRCSECHAVFDAMASLTTSIPEPYTEITSKSTDSENSSTNDGRQSHNHQQPNHSRLEKPGLLERTQNINPRWLNAIAFSLITLLLAQLLYNHRHYITHEPLHAPEQIEMLNNNVFAHPNEQEVLLISASIENHAEYPQPYPVLEVSLSNSSSNQIALRRFKPSEYIENYNKRMLMPVNQPVNLKLKIADPGKDATRFQFKFM